MSSQSVLGIFSCYQWVSEGTHVVSLSLSFFRKPRAFLVRFFSPSIETHTGKERVNIIIRNSFEVVIAKYKINYLDIKMHLKANNKEE